MPEREEQPPPEERDPLQLARETLAAARAAARTRSAGMAGRRRPADRQQGTRRAADGAAEAGAGAGAGAGQAGQAGQAGGRAARPGFAPQPRRSDPAPLSAAVEGLLEAEGWTLAAATGSVFGRWAEIVGADLAAHTRPETLADGVLTVAADSTAWATQLRLLAGQLLSRLNQELGQQTVRRVQVRGPVTADRRPGQWRVRGGRGERDTYG